VSAAKLPLICGAALHEKNPTISLARPEPLGEDRFILITIGHDMDQISNRAQSVTPSLTLAVTNEVKRLQREGELVYGLAGGEPDIDTPIHIKEAAIKALNDGKTKYTPSSGLMELRESIANKLQVENGLNYNPEDVVVSTGGKQACFNALAAVLNEGDEVIIPAPYWVSYPEMVKLAGGTPVIIETKESNHWKITAEQFEEAMTPSTKMIILNTPGNPTGAVYSREELAAIGEIATYEDILILSDEIYEKMIYGTATHTSIGSISEEIANLTITVGGFSKAYAMTGWRLGYTAAPPAIAKAIATIQSHTTSNATAFAQYGAIAALDGPMDFLDDLKAEYDVRRQFMLGRLRGINGVRVTEPHGAFYFFLNCVDLGIKSQNLADKLLSRYQVASVPGAAFGHDHGLRFSYCTSFDILSESLDRFEKFCKEH